MKNKTNIIKLCCLCFFLLSNTKSFAQKDSLTFKKNAIFFEMGGVGGYHSMNYERAIPLYKNLDLGLRAGLSTYDVMDYKSKFNPNITIPMMVGLKYGRKHYAEAGIGETYSNTVEADINTGEPTRKSNYSTIMNFGYRYQKPNGGLLFRCGYTPIIEFNKRYYHWFGLSIGYTL